MYEYPYPYNQPNWTAPDQRYWCKMVNVYRFPVNRAPVVYQYIITSGKSSTWETEYAQYLQEQTTTI